MFLRARRREETRQSSYVNRWSNSLARIFHDGSLRNRQAASPGLRTPRRVVDAGRGASESGVRRPEVLRRTRAVRRGTEGRVRRPKACRSSESAIAAEVLMNDVG